MKNLLLPLLAALALPTAVNADQINSYETEQKSYVSAMETCQRVLKEHLSNDPFFKAMQIGDSTYSKFNHQLVCTSGSKKPKSKIGYIKGSIYYQEIEASTYEGETVKIPSDSESQLFFATYPRYENYSIRELERALKR